TAMVTIWCLVNGEPSSEAFSVNVGKSATIDGLKKAIKAKKPNNLGGVDAHKLTLWCVRIPITSMRQITLKLPNNESIQSLNLEDGQEIQSQLNGVEEVGVKLLAVPSRTIAHKLAF
ncbi:hypothetical protein BGX34_008645, partial [Mortierella sp. NVP85]